MNTYQTYREQSVATAERVAAAVGPNAVALFVEGGQGTLSRVFRVVKLPGEAFARETKGGSVSRRLRAYARRKALEVGIHPGNRIDAIPVVWIGPHASCQVFVWG